MREQEIKLQKVKKSCSTARKITKGITILLLAAAIICVGAAIGSYVFRDTINPVLAANQHNLVFENMNIGGLVDFDAYVVEMAQNGSYVEALITVCVYGGINCLFLAFVFGSISKVFKSMEISESPFSEDVLKKLKRSFIVLAILTGLVVGVGTGLLLALFLWCIYCILEYGAALQVEVDETI